MLSTQSSYRIQTADCSYTTLRSGANFYTLNKNLISCCWWWVLNLDYHKRSCIRDARIFFLLFLFHYFISSLPALSHSVITSRSARGAVALCVRCFGGGLLVLVLLPLLMGGDNHQQVCWGLFLPSCAKPSRVPCLHSWGAVSPGAQGHRGWVIPSFSFSNSVKPHHDKCCGHSPCTCCNVHRWCPLVDVFFLLLWCACDSTWCCLQSS